jgi:aspartate-semialdehyde dehydrogenase
VKIAIIGASGAVGREIVNELEKSSIADLQPVLLASPRSQGRSISFRGKHLTVKAYSRDEVLGCPYILMSAGGEFSKAHSLAIAEASQGIVIDNSSAWRMDPQVPLVVPEINGSLLEKLSHPVIANPNCSTIQLVMSLAPLQERWGLELVNVATYQSVSGTGQKGIDELSQQVRDRLNFTEVVSRVYPQPIAFNVLPAIGAIAADGYCEEELKMINETRKIMDCASLSLLATSARVPVFYCHSQAVTVKLKGTASYEELCEVWRHRPGIALAPHREDQPTPLQLTGQSAVSISRVRLLQGEQRSAWLTYWNIADNLKKGAATNAVQIFEALYRHQARR